MPIQTVETQRLYRQIANQLAKLIEGGEFKLGERLPSEHNLAQQLGVSRLSVREALIALEVEGYIEVRVGSGVYVTSVSKSTSAPLPTDSGPFEIMQARRLIESECAALAANEATRAQIQAIEEALNVMVDERREVKAIPLAADRLFHLRIAEASGNSAFVLTVKTLWDQRFSPLFTQLDKHFTTPESRTVAIKEHRDVVNAIAKRDAKTARLAMRQHLDMATKRFSQSFSERK